MSKQDIKKRLGFAAQGVKAEMASIPGITDLPYEANPQGTHRYKVGDQVKDKRHPSFQGTIKRLMRDKYGYPSYVVYTQGGGPQDAQDSDLVLAARPGVKIKFSAQFEVGRVYEHSFIGDYDAIVQWKVLSRTESTLTIKKVGEGNRNSATTPTRGEEKRVKINSDAQGEFVYPMGKFSMAPILRASKTTASRPGVKAKMETPMRVALTPMHTRAEQGYENFISNLMKLGGITREQAQKAFKAFKDAKVLVTKEQYRGGGITVKHGAFMERDVIRRAAGLPEESSRPGVKAKMAARPGVTVGAPDIAYVRGVGQDYGRRASEKGIARLIDDNEALARIRLLKYGVDAMSPLRSKIDKAFDEGWLKGLTQEKIQRAENPTKFKVGDRVLYSIGTSTHVGTVARVLASAKPEPEYLVNFTTLPTGSPRRNVSESSLRKTSAARPGAKAKA